MRKGFTFISFIIGFLLCGLLVWLFQKNEKTDDNSYVVLTNQIQKMNKMIVAEQTSSSFITHKSAPFHFGGYDFFPKEMMVYSEVKAQVTYDLNQLKYQIDSTNKKLIIQQIPNAEIKFYPNSKIHYMNDSFANEFDKNSINKIIASANQNVITKIDQKQLITQARTQLLINLNDLFFLAKALKYSIDDQTGQNIEIFN